MKENLTPILRILIAAAFHFKRPRSKHFIPKALTEVFKPVRFSDSFVVSLLHIIKNKLVRSENCVSVWLIVCETYGSSESAITRVVWNSRIGRFGNNRTSFTTISCNYVVSNMYVTFNPCTQQHIQEVIYKVHDAITNLMIIYVHSTRSIRWLYVLIQVIFYNNWAELVMLNAFYIVYNTLYISLCVYAYVCLKTY